MAEGVFSRAVRATRRRQLNKRSAQRIATRRASKVRAPRAKAKALREGGRGRAAHLRGLERSRARRQRIAAAARKDR